MKKAVLKSHAIRQNMATACVQSGERAFLQDTPVFPIWQTATFTFANYQEIAAFNEGRSSKTKYGRYGNPIQKALERKLAELEGAQGCLLFASGMNAITTTALALLRTGDHALYCEALYRNTARFFREVLPAYGIETTCIPANDPKALAASLKANTRFVFYEVPTNLFLRVSDVRTLAGICRRHNSAPVFVADSTFATPYCYRPLEHGADLVIHSLTKYLAGHDDLLSGCVCGSDELIKKICAYRDVLGGIADPHNTFLCMRSLKTFPVRMERLNRTGHEIARFLEGHPGVKEVFYPGLKSHPDHKMAKRILRGFGSVIYFRVTGGLHATKRFIESLRLPLIGTNFGGVHTFIEPTSVLTFGKLSKKQRAEQGVGEDLIRLCLGLEDPKDIIADMVQALSKSATRRH